ncbi:putative RNA-directed DNA polymerase from transposon X-element [Trichonephila clavipes]|uniref:Putative RNA-directed DNA polymerase from transposon X-element n=1 Tax=Trichonephila clavipes TaxID=2585209 RepID=A0A8X6SW07_TRICX|nr:putative RNA-directed DNA polymerase from transposon X-element [Trichonephila clavipes]
MDEEFDNLKLRNVWKLMKLPPDKQLLGCRWVYNLKRDENGKVIRYKARLVAQGYSQVKGKGIMYSKRQCPQSSDEKREMKIIPYRNVLGCLSFLSGQTRPDISYTVNIFSQFQNDPGLEHWYGLLKLFGYVNKTKHYKLRLDCMCINIVGFSDADFAANRDDRISMGGQFICLGNAPVTWRTFKEKSVMKGGSFVNREKINSLIPFKIVDKWSNYLICLRPRVSVTFDRVIESRQEGGDFRHDEYKKQDVTL